MKEFDNSIAASSFAGIEQITESLLSCRESELVNEKVKSIPIDKIATLGAGVASLFPNIKKVTAAIDGSGIYRVVNAGAGDALKAAKNGNFWGAMKTAEGSSKMAQLAPVDSLQSTVSVAAGVNPYLLLIVVALYAVEQKMDKITETGKQILSFLENEKQSEIEADVETLSNIITKYKFNWDNEYYISSNHKMVLDIQRTARKNMLSYKKKVEEMSGSGSKLIVARNKVTASLKGLLKDFQYYRLALYSFSLSSLLEIMLSGNFMEEGIAESIAEIEKHASDYRELFSKGSVYLEKMSKSAIETNVLKGVATASNALGKMIGGIPKIKEGQVDEFLQEKGEKIKKAADTSEKDAIRSFSSLSDPQTSVFVEKMKDLIQIYNHTNAICLDSSKVYLISD